MRRLFVFAAIVSVVGSASFLSSTQARGFRERMAARAEQGVETPAPSNKVELSYGNDPLQKLDFWAARDKEAPLVIFVHGGGWKRGAKSAATGHAKVRDWLDQGYAVASLNYRLVPAVTVEDQAQDVADAIAYMRVNAAKLGFDPSRIALSGHSAGAHLVALVGTDEQYLKRAGMGLSAIRGVLAIDGAAYDVPAQMKDGPRIMQSTYQQAFGDDPARQKALSPTLQAAAPNAPGFLIIHVQRDDGIRQSRAFAEALKGAGTPVAIEGFPGTGLKAHMEINRSLGNSDYPATPVVDKWLASLFDRG